MSDPGNEDSSRSRPAVCGLLIVARDQRDLYEALQYAYGDSETITVFLDRRQRERRQAVQPMLVLAEQRRGERRRPATIADDLRFQQYVRVRPHDRRPHD